jgi:HK97 family phage major capsid protein/HK97 family phage prohead protease
MNKAYSILNIKTVDQDQRRISGIATTPEVDRVGDIVEPMGVKFKNPMPLLWQHDSRKPVGRAWFKAPTAEGIPFDARIEKMDEPGVLKDRLDEAWQSLKLGLVTGASIGFRVLNNAVEILKDGGLRFLETEVMELSLVTIPANSQASIQTIKSADQQSRSAALRATTVTVVKLAKSTPGASGSTSKGTDMKTIREQISAFEAKRQASAAAATEIMEKAGQEGTTLTEDQKQKYDALLLEVKEVDEHLGRLRDTDALNIEKAQPVKPEAGKDPDLASKGRAPAGSGIRVESKLEPGVRFARMAMAMARAKGMAPLAEQFYRAERRWMDTAPEVAIALKANEINAGDSTTATWASELAYAQNIASEFIEFLRPKTIIGRVTGWRNVPFNVRVASQTSGATGYWVGQGKPIIPSQMATSSVSLGIAKVAGLVAISKELAMLSTPSAELMVRNDLARECQQTLDLSLIDPNQGGLTNIQPASLLYGVTPVTPTGITYATFVADWKTLTSTMIAADVDLATCVVVMSHTTAQALSMIVTSLGNQQFPGLSMLGGTLQGLPVITTQAAKIAGSPQFGEMIVLLNPAEVFLADDGNATIEASDQVSIEMKDNATNQSTATSVGTSMVSMFQTESIAVKAVRHINWAKARSQAAAFIQAAAYTG